MEVGDKTTIKVTTAGLHFTASVLVCGSESLLVVQDNVIFSADIESSYSKLTCSLHIEELGEARLPKTVELLGADNQFKGTLTNIQTLIVSSGQVATFSKMTRTATYKDGVLTAQEVGAYRFAKFIIKDYATVTFETTGKVLQLTILELHYGSTLKGERILLQSNEILLQPGSTIDLSGGGYDSEQGPGKGLQISGEDLATGAGYASPGGSPSESNTGGDIYNLTRVPGEEGSGGGNSNSGVGGAGGGYLKIETFYDLTNYGVIKVDGTSATGNGAGGGSGGTIVAYCRNLLGDGTLSVNGGQGSGKGGGGSGGRMKFIFTQSFDFDGTITAYGGGNDDNLNTVKAGAGTIYIQDGTGNSLMNRLWIIGDTESSVQKQTHTLISGTTSDDFYYNVLSLKGYSYADIEGATTFLRIDNINGDNTGTMNVQNQQILKAEVFEGEQRHFITNINIDLAEQATLHVPLNMTVSGCTVNLKGRVTFNNLIVENGGTVILEPTSMTATYSGGVYDVSASTPGVYSLGYIGLKFGSTFSPSVGLQLIAVSMDMKRYIVLYSDFVDLKIATLTMERGAELNVVGKALDSEAPSTAHGTNNNGGSFASEGGVDIFTLDGILRANGDSSTSGGGGSGGSIYVKCASMLKGFGLMESNGGDTSSSSAGGGSGGRIAAYSEEDLYTGVGAYRAKGGDSSATNGRGGPGSIYTKIGSGKNEFETLTVDNENGQTIHYLTLNENNTDINFDLLNVENYAKLQVTEDGKNRLLNVKNVNGDGTGLIRMRQNQIGTLERFSLDVLISKLEINLELHNGGEFILSETTTILGKGTTALDLDGIMRGAVNLIVGTTRHMRMGSNAWIIPLKATELSTQARVSFGLLQLDPGSSLDFDENTGAEMLVGTLNAKFKSRITADYFNISCSNINIELEAKLSAASEDRIGSENIDILSGKANGTYGGAGHGGVGGGSKTIAGDSYGSIYHPKDTGSRAHSTGGRGGGKIYLKAGLSVINDGEISVNGSSSTLGGGSGGSIWVETYYIEGYGVFSTVGGSGSGSYGAGSAGRISIDSKLVIEYEGEYYAFGGAGSNDELAAGGGTVYLEDIRKGVAYRRLMLDNLDRSIEKYSTIDEQTQTEFYFDEVHIMRKASLQVRDKGIDIFMDIRQLYGDRSGLLHLHNNQRFIVEYEQGIRQALTSGVNFIVDDGGEIIIPAISYIYGKGVHMTGVTRNLDLYKYMGDSQVWLT
ncbi:Hypothetical predicted protein [Mytilus galloprovincialis]|uniref:Uncharacterized protein n=1 Tax=Mytilus galloprovincialis TaxID=29158 RepID=A0A8B6E0A9_MYTGA|nr:Hypothetical predicted protein [Mytilus galloprovincialis]